MVFAFWRLSETFSFCANALQGLPNELLKLLGEELLRITVLQGADAEGQLSFRRLEELLLHRDPNLLVAQVIQGKVLD